MLQCVVRHLSIIVAVQEVKGLVDCEVLAEQHFRLLPGKLRLLKVHTSTVNLPKVDTSTVNLPKVHTSTVNLPKVHTSTVNLPKVYTSTVQFSSIQSLDWLGRQQRPSSSLFCRSRDFHSLMLPIQHFPCRPRRRPPFCVPWRMVLERLSWCVTCPSHASFRLLTVARRSSCGTTRQLILLRAQSLVLCSKVEDTKKFPQALGFESLDPFFRVSKQVLCFTAIGEDGCDKRLAELKRNSHTHIQYILARKFSATLPFTGEKLTEERVLNLHELEGKKRWIDLITLRSVVVRWTLRSIRTPTLRDPQNGRIIIWLNFFLVFVL